MCYHADPRKAILKLEKAIPASEMPSTTEIQAITDREVVDFLEENTPLLKPETGLPAWTKGYSAQITLAVVAHSDEQKAIRRHLAHQKAKAPKATGPTFLDRKVKIKAPVS
jgi:hypothetical protein